MMRILIAADYSTPASGNFVASIFELGKKMREKGDDLVYCFPLSANTSSDQSWTNWLKREGFKVYLIDKNADEKEQLSSLQAIIKEHSIDLMHVHFGMFHHIALRYSRQLGVRILIHDHMAFFTGQRTKRVISCMLKSIAYRISNIGIVLVSQEKYKAYTFARHWYLPNGLSLIRNVEHSATREECRAEMGLTEKDRMCLFLGWAAYIKGLDIAVKAVQELRKEYPDLILGIVGIGDPPNQRRLDFIRTRAGVDPKSSWIKYLPSREDMFAYHRATDVYLSASRTEAFSYGLLEAISQNTPVAVSEIKGTNWSREYNKAFFYPTEDYHECAQAIKKALLTGRCESNFTELIDKFSIDRWFNGIHSIYKQMLGKKNDN